jgi:hypothetical protein
MTRTFHLGVCRVDVGERYTTTRFADGREIVGAHDEQPGQAELAASLGYPDAWHLNRHHDLGHTFVSTMLGLPHSMTLRAIADGGVWPNYRLEEAAVLAVQSFALAAGIDLLDSAARHSR